MEAAFIFARVLSHHRGLSRISQDGETKFHPLSSSDPFGSWERERENSYPDYLGCWSIRFSVILCFVHYAQQQNFASFYTESNFFISSLLFHLSILFFNGEPIVSGIRGRECFYMVYFYQDRLNGSPVEIAVTGSKIWTGILKSVISGTWGKKKNRWTKKYSRPAYSKKRYMCMTYIKIYRSINSGCKHCFSSYARIHFRLWFIRDFRDFSCSIIALGRGGKKIQERNFISTVYSNENASGSRYRYESIFSSTSARISRIPINVLRSFLSFFFAQQRNGGLETSNDIMCRLIFPFRSRKLGERSWRKIVLLPDDRSISTIQRSKRRRKTPPSTNHVHERVGRRGIRGIQSRETRCVRNKRKKLPLLSLPFPRPWPRFDKKSF